MDEKLGSLRALPSIRTTSEEPNQISPSRSRTDPPVAHKHHDKSHLHRRLHSNSLRNRAFTGSREHSHGYRHAAKETVQSAIELKPPISFDTLLRRDKKSPDSSRRGSGSLQNHNNTQQSRDYSDQATQQARQVAQRRISPKDVEKAKRDNVQREKELRDSLKSVEETAMSSTRQLDDTYYAILEKASLLRNTVASLQQLAEESRGLHSSFREDTDTLAKDTEKNVAAFGNFDQQEKNINELVSRLSSSKDKTTKMNERLEAARNRIEAFEQQEKERQKARRIRYSAIWIACVGVLVLIVAVLVAKKRNAVGSRMHNVAKTLDEFGKEIASPVAALLKPSPTEDSILGKLFDDL